MYEFLWLTSPFDDDDDDFSFEEGHAELAAEIREYADEDDYEFGDEERVAINPRPTPVQPPPSTPVGTAPVKKVSPKPAVAKKTARNASAPKNAVGKSAPKKQRSEPAAKKK